MANFGTSRERVLVIGNWALGHSAFSPPSAGSRRPLQSRHGFLAGQSGAGHRRFQRPGPGDRRAVRRRGRKIAIAALEADAVQRAAAEMQAAGRDVLGIQADITRQEDVDRMFERGRSTVSAAWTCW